MRYSFSNIHDSSPILRRHQGFDSKEKLEIGNVKGKNWLLLEASDITRTRRITTGDKSSYIKTNTRLIKTPTSRQNKTRATKIK